ncbi:MAG: flagellar hook-associated protein FlgL [Polyangiaceae bacterium]
MRVTESMRVSAIERSYATTSASLYGAEARAASGAKVSAPSDDPAAFARIVAHDGSLAKLEARTKALSRASSDAEMAEGALASAGDVMAAARELATQMADGAYNASDRAAAAKQVTEMRQALVGLANAQGTAGYLFGGTASGAPPFDASGVFHGNDQAQWVEVSDGVTLRANAEGAKAFTAAGGRDVLLDLDNLATALQANDVASVGASISSLQAGHEQIVGARAAAGATLVRLASASDVASRAHLLVTRARAVDHDADAFEAYSALASAQSAFSRSIEVSKRLFSTLSAEGA